MAEMHLSKIERGSGNPAFGTLKRIAAALDMPVAALAVRAAELEDDA
jgi:transcriptional regulator with XRE-family HTH domain